MSSYTERSKSDLFFAVTVTVGTDSDRFTELKYTVNFFDDPKGYCEATNATLTDESDTATLTEQELKTLEKLVIIKASANEHYFLAEFDDQTNTWKLR